MTEITLGQFLNGLKILNSIDAHELIGVGLDAMLDDDKWRLFRDDPFSWMMRAPSPDVEAVWRVMIKRGIVR